MCEFFQSKFEGDGTITWVRSQLDYIKVTVDTVIFKEQLAYEMGMVARNHEGELIQAKSLKQYGVVTPALALEEALSWIETNAWDPVVIEIHYLTVVQASRSKVSMSFGMVIEECKRYN